MSDENNKEQKFFDADGNEVEGVLTAQEVEKKLEEAQTKAEEEANKKLEEYQKATDEEVEAMKKELEETKEELAKEKDKDKNFGNLRKSKDESNGKIKELTEKVEKLEKGIEETKSQASEQMISSAIKAKSGDDKELEEKIKFHFNQFTPPKNTEELKQKVESAYILATGGQAGNTLSGETISGAGGASEPAMPAEGGVKGHKLSEAGKEVGKKMGITDQDYEKAKKRGIIK